VLICIVAVSTCIVSLHRVEFTWPGRLFKFVRGSADRRNLFSLPDGVPNPNDLQDNANNIIGDGANKIGDGANQIGNLAGETFEKIKLEMQKAQGLLNSGVAIMQSAYDSSIQFGHKMDDLYVSFQPLENLFASSHGLVPLLTSTTNLQNLVSFLTKLLEDAGELVVIGDSVGKVADLFGRLLDFFNNELAALNPNGRKLFGFPTFPPVPIPPVPIPTIPPIPIPQIDFTQLLADLNFEDLKTEFEGYKAEAQTLVDDVSKINATVYPLLKQLNNSLAGRRLQAWSMVKSALQEVQDNQVKYEGAVLGIIPAWRKGEDITCDVCGAISAARKEVVQLKCRVDEFTKQVQAPPTLPDLEKIKTHCFAATANPPASETCPSVKHSAGVRDMLSQQAGALGWFAATFDYAIKHYTVVRITSAVVIGIVGLMMALFGYRYKDCEFWIEGFLAGLVVWSVVISVIIVYFGMCRGQYIDTCEPRILLIIVVILSTGCACVTVKLQAAQEFLAGFDLGALTGGFAFLAWKHEEVFNTFVSADDSKPIMTQLMLSAFVTGVVVGLLTHKFTKLVLIIGTSVIGSFGIIVAVALFFPHYLDKPDLIAWGILSVVFSLVQYFGTSHRDSRYDRVEKSVDDGGSDSDSDNEATYRS